MPRFAANLSMLFTEEEFLDRFDAAADAGFNGVEYLFPYDFPVEVIKARLNANNLTQVLFNLPAGDWSIGERGIACHPERVAEFRAGGASHQLRQGLGQHPDQLLGRHPPARL